MPEKSLKKNAFLNAIKTVMSLIFPLITFPYASRILLPEAIGKVNFANSIVSYFSLLASLGISTYAIRGAASVRKNKTLLSKFVKEMLTINFISTIVAYFLLFIAIFFVPKFSEYRVLLFISSSTILLSTLGIGWLYSALEEYTYITVRSLIFQFISLIFLFVFVKNKDDYVLYLIYGILSSVGSNICNYIHSKKYVDLHIKVKLELKKHLKGIFILFASNLAISIYTILDTSMLGFLSTDSQVGFYSAASKISRMIRDLFPAVTTVLFARFSFYFVNKEEEKILSLIQKTMNFIFCFSIPIAVGIFILAEPVILLLCSSSYIEAKMSLIWFCPLIIFSASSCFLGGQVLISMGKDKQYLFVTGIAALIAIITNYIFIPIYGSTGAAFATTLTEFIIFIFYIVFLRKILAQVKLVLPILQYIFSSIVMGFVVYYTRGIFNNILLQVLIPSFIGMLVYAIMLFITRNTFFLEISKQLIQKLRKIK